GYLALIWVKDRPQKNRSQLSPSAGLQRLVERVPGQKDTLRLLPDAAAKFTVTTAEVKKAPPPAPLRLPGTLLLAPDRLARVRSRFAGEVTEIGTLTAGRPARLGDPVRKGQLLAVVWSKDLGEKKSELVDALSRLRLDQDALLRMKKLLQEGAAPERSVREAERSVEADLIAIERVRRTLRSWRLTDEEIKAVEQEADRTSPGKGPRAMPARGAEDGWARSELRAPFDGMVAEINVARGDIVDTALDLFKIADLSSLRVVAHAAEEDVPVLQQLC